jgi:membrane protein implicated in regulation of membrane protease activity
VNRRTAYDCLVVVLYFGLAVYLLPRLLAVWAVAPTWVQAAVVAAVIPLAAVGGARDARRSRRRRRKELGLCASCGYSLTGNTSGVCPECGAAVGAARDPAD